MRTESSLGEDSSVIPNFVRGWMQGYQSASGHSISESSLFDAWSWIRMKNDMYGDLSIEEISMIDKLAAMALQPD
ncbi:hypothetical protein JOC77_000565 [Peribacillus deserti]|uniref:YozE SAM-like domain-containing protein n=1 Tax=Peribacillus deserti TaxID=673318 RepID=A0ABS2QDC4_9BACI|nr:hypothetical protein [Peribacillus deserti]MBM7691160.1 hypothetical protein [Peribacillus deserti]